MTKHTISLLLLVCTFLVNAQAQTTVPLTDMSFWQPTKGSNWRIAGGATADFNKEHLMKATKGTGVLVNMPDNKNRDNLVSVSEYGDVSLSFEFMMSKYSNSGFYLQGRYEVQLLDSWGRKDPAFNDCGGIFARRRFEPKEELFEGHAPQQNACLAPGLWQKMDITFRAPRFDATGKKIANAKMVLVRLNGVTVQENVELNGPTGGPISETEAPRGPFLIQGDHGEVAFRRFNITPIGNNPPKIGAIQYEVINGDFRDASEFKDKKPDLTGTATVLTWEAAGSDNGFVLTDRFNLNIEQPGSYEVTLQVGGNSIMRINGNTVLPQKWTYSTVPRTATIELPKGAIPVEIVYFKMDNWMPPVLKCSVKAPDGSLGEYHSFSSTLALEPSDPIFLDANEPMAFRSFMDYYEGGKFQKRMVHPVQVGHPDRIHYSYDLDNGALAQVWRGKFLNASPMWDNRGDGSSQPRGMVIPLGDRATLVAKAGLLDTTTVSPTNGFRILGYDLEEGNLPDFRYQLAGATVKDHIRITDGKYLSRTIELTEGTPAAPLFCRLAQATTITEVEKGLYAIDDFSYFIRIPKEAKAEIISAAGFSVLYLPMASSINYDIIF